MTAPAISAFPTHTVGTKERVSDDGFRATSISDLTGVVTLARTRCTGERGVARVNSPAAAMGYVGRRMRDDS